MSVRIMKNCNKWYGVTCRKWVPTDLLFTFPGMIELPGSFSGSDSSPSPHLGPEARNRKSLAIFMMEQAITFNAPEIVQASGKRDQTRWSKMNSPETSTIASCAASASNLLGAVSNGRPVIFETSSATFSAKPILVLTKSVVTKGIFFYTLHLHL